MLDNNWFMDFIPSVHIRFNSDIFYYGKFIEKFWGATRKRTLPAAA